jgi:protein SCO1
MTGPFRTAALLGVLVPLLALAGCGTRAGEASGSVSDADAEAAAAVSTSGDRFSVYALREERWWDRRGDERELGSLAGRVQVVAMVYTHCHHTCPQIVADMKRLEAELAAAGTDAGFVLVSLDPERDTPEQLQRFAEGLRLDAERWTLLTGTDGGTRALAALLNVRYRAEAEREIAHTNQLTVLDPEGRIVHQRPGLDEDLAATLAAVRRAAVAGAADP